jgi:hypothetical protein
MSHLYGIKRVLHYKHEDSRERERCHSKHYRKDRRKDWK